MSLAVKPKYTTDLAGQMAEAEMNYARIMRLLPQLESVDCCQFEVTMPGERQIDLHVTVTDRCRYTTMLDLRQTSHSQPWAPGPYFSIRVYHDVRMAEVVAFHRYRGLKPVYDYPNERMFQRDEKAQLNKLLGEWLSHCLHHGYATDCPVACELSR